MEYSSGILIHFIRAAGYGSVSLPILLLGWLSAFLSVVVILNVLKQLLLEKPYEPPVVFHFFPFIGSTISYGIDPINFFFKNREKYGDVFTFILLGKKTTVCLGTKGNDLILNGKLKDVNAEEVYSPLTTPVFGKDVIYDCPNSKLMEQKKFVKFGLTTKALQSYVDLIGDEVQRYIRESTHFKGQNGVLNVTDSMAEITIYTASRSLQGDEVRAKLDHTFADLYHDLDMGFSPINFMFPWAPFPHNKRRDIAHQKIAQIYMQLIQSRREASLQGNTKESQDMIWNLMKCKYKDDVPVPDHEIAHMMIALLMAGQHSSSSTISWIILRLASKPHIVEELYQEQVQTLGESLPNLTYADLSRLTLHSNVVRETLRLHAPIHSIMRKVKSPIIVEDSSYVIPTSHVLLAAPGVTSRMPEYFPDPLNWEPHRWEEGHKLYSGRTIPKGDEEKVDYGYGVVSKGANSPYLPFGAGRHRCIGEQFAYLQLQTILAYLVRNFKFRNIGGTSDVVGTDYSSLFSRPLTPALVEWEKRSF